MSIMVENSLCTTGRPKMDASSLVTALTFRTWLIVQPKLTPVMGR
jgi:hypothetical protein